MTRNIMCVYIVIKWICKGVTKLKLVCLCVCVFVIFFFFRYYQHFQKNVPKTTTFHSLQVEIHYETDKHYVCLFLYLLIFIFLSHFYYVLHIYTKKDLSSNWVIKMFSRTPLYLIVRFFYAFKYTNTSRAFHSV